MDSQTPEPKPVPRLTLTDFVFPFAATIVAMVTAVIVIAGAEEHRQGGVMRVMLVFILWGIANLIWLVFFSRLVRKVRYIILAVTLLPAFAFLAMFKLEGFSGDFVPIMTPRWAIKEMAAPVLAEPSVVEGEQPIEGAGDFSQFLGNDRDIRVGSLTLSTDWKGNPQEELWRIEVGAAWSGFAVVGKHAVTMEQRTDEEAVIAYHLTTGKPLWVYSYPARYDNPIGGLGPRTTPAIVGDRVYSFGATGILTALELKTGKLVWKKDVAGMVGASLPEWGFASSPLFHDGAVVVSTGAGNGNSLVALDAETGEKLWTGGSDGAAWSTPVLSKVAGKDVVLMITKSLLTAHDPSTGDPVWTYPWDNNNRPNVSVPLLYSGDRLLLSSGYSKGAELIQVQKVEDGKFSASRVWKSLAMKAKFTNLAIIGDRVFGLDDGILACVDLETGKRVWKDGRYGHGQILLVGELFLITCESGEIALVEANPEEHVEKAKMEVFNDKMWNPPALAGQYLIVRTHKEAACLKLPVVE